MCIYVCLIRRLNGPICGSVVIDKYHFHQDEIAVLRELRSDATPNADAPFHCGLKWPRGEGPTEFDLDASEEKKSETPVSDEYIAIERVR